MELGMYFFENLFSEYLPVLISGSGAGEESEFFYCAVQEMGRLGPYKKIKPLKSAFLNNSIFGNNRDPYEHQRDRSSLIDLNLLWTDDALLIDLVSSKSFNPFYEPERFRSKLIDLNPLWTDHALLFSLMSRKSFNPILMSLRGSDRSSLI